MCCGIGSGHVHPAVARSAVALDRGATGIAHRCGAIPGGAGPGAAARPALSHLQHTEPGHWSPATGDLASSGLAVHQIAAVDMVHLWGRRPAGARRCGLCMGHIRGQCQHAGAGVLAAAHPGPLRTTAHLATHGTPPLAHHPRLCPTGRSCGACHPGRSDFVHIDGPVHCAPGHRGHRSTPDRGQRGGRTVHGATVAGHCHQCAGELLAGGWQHSPGPRRRFYRF